MRGTELDNISSFVEASPLEFFGVAIRSLIGMPESDERASYLTFSV
jgi:hypothetical protein